MTFHWLLLATIFPEGFSKCSGKCIFYSYKRVLKSFRSDQETLSQNKKKIKIKTSGVCSFDQILSNGSGQELFSTFRRKFVFPLGEISLLWRNKRFQVFLQNTLLLDFLLLCMSSGSIYANIPFYSPLLFNEWSYFHVSTQL